MGRELVRRMRGADDGGDGGAAIRDLSHADKTV